ncbi:hypothetical protein [Acidisarcina polymorpha]|nr:hypothetical protein [Acidisarcina polymorpha]
MSRRSGEYHLITMKQVVALSLGLALAGTAWAQHGAMSGHASGPAMHSGGFSSGRTFSPPSQSLSNGARSFTPRPGLSDSQQRFSTGGATGPAPFGATQPPNSYRGSHWNGGYRPYYSRGVYLVPGWLNSGFYGYGYSGDYSGDQEAVAAPDPGGMQAPGNEQMPPGPGYDQQGYAPMPPRPEYQPQPSSSSEPPAQPEVTLLFKDGRPPQQVQNYALTQTTLYVFDGAKRREIPLEQLDLEGTEKTNRDAGIDFQVPTEGQ